MVTKANGPLMEDYKRAIKAAKWAGWKAVRIEFKGMAIAILADETYMDRLALGQPPAPNAEEEKREPHNWKDW